MIEAYYQLLEKCCAKVVNGKQGTAFFVSPRLAVTCAHVLPEGKKEGDWVEITPYGLELSEKAQIKSISRDSFEDYCILLTEKFIALTYVILNELTDISIQEQKLLGYGFPALDYLQLESIVGKYAGNIKPGKFGKYFPIHKLSRAQIKPGYSGSPIINTKTGRCIGMVFKTIDKNSDIGGWLISADLILKHLSNLHEYWPVESKEIVLQWNNARQQHLDEEIREEKKREHTKIYEPYDLAYLCDRTEFSESYKLFDKYSVSQSLKVNHYLIIGKTVHSPVGVARKLIYENIVKKTSSSFYPSNPAKPSGRSIKLKADYTTTIDEFLKDVRLLYISNPDFEKEKLTEQNESLVLSDLIRNFNANAYNLHIVSVEFPALKKRQAKVFSFLKNLTELLEQNKKLINSQVYFFWCFTPERFSRNDSAYIILQKIVVNNSIFQSPVWYLLRLIPILNQIMIRATLKKLTPSDYFIWPLNKTNILKKPPNKYVGDWINDINGRNMVVNKRWIEDILQKKHTIEIENEFIEIITQYNSTVKNSL